MCVPVQYTSPQNSKTLVDLLVGVSSLSSLFYQATWLRAYSCLQQWPRGAVARIGRATHINTHIWELPARYNCSLLLVTKKFHYNSWVCSNVNLMQWVILLFVFIFTHLTTHQQIGAIAALSIPIFQTKCYCGNS